MIRCLAAVVRAWWREAVLRRPRVGAGLDPLAGRWVHVSWPDGPTVWGIEISEDDPEAVDALLSYWTLADADFLDGDPDRTDGICGSTVGPVWAAGGEWWICELPAGHRGDHAAGYLDDGVWETVWSRS